MPVGFWILTYGVGAFAANMATLAVAGLLFYVIRRHL